jgi:hypothetical protein
MNKIDAQLEKELIDSIYHACHKHLPHFLYLNARNWQNFIVDTSKTIRESL